MASSFRVEGEVYEETGLKVDDKKGCNRFLRRVGSLSVYFMELYHTRWNSVLSLLRKQFMTCVKFEFLVITPGSRGI
jgi:hypothetical protein